jgi:pyridoxine/pyridoxamine 5'-phosphate oxidase
MTPKALLGFMRSCRYAVQASVNRAGAPQAAVVGIAVGDDFDIIFDTMKAARKAVNLRLDPRIALVLGGQALGDERTLQIEGVAGLPEGPELEEARRLYLAKFPDGAERMVWAGSVFVRVRPQWFRFSDFNQDPAEIIHFNRRDLGLPHTAEDFK